MDSSYSIAKHRNEEDIDLLDYFIGLTDGYKSKSKDCIDKIHELKKKLRATRK